MKPLVGYAIKTLAASSFAIKRISGLNSVPVKFVFDAWKCKWKSSWSFTNFVTERQYSIFGNKQVRSDLGLVGIADSEYSANTTKHTSPELHSPFSNLLCRRKISKYSSSVSG